MGDKVHIQVRPDEAGTRLDALLASRLRLSRQRSKAIVESGAVLVDGLAARKGVALRGGEAIVVSGFVHPDEAKPLPEPDAPLTVLATSTAGDWLIVDKPAGSPVHPLRAEEGGTVLNAVAARHPQVLGVGEGGLRCGVVHRLDVETSGTLAVALTADAWTRLRQAFEQRRLLKRYVAIVGGVLTGGRDEALWLSVAQHKPAKVRAVPSGTRDARRCTLSWRTREAGPDATLVEVDLGTGFLHQIRAMLAHLGHPLVGDTLYGGPMLAGASRPMLHALVLEFDGVRGVSDPPADFRTVWDALRRAD